MADSRSCLGTCCNFTPRLWSIAEQGFFLEPVAEPGPAVGLDGPLGPGRDGVAPEHPGVTPARDAHQVLLLVPGREPRVREAVPELV